MAVEAVDSYVVQQEELSKFPRSRLEGKRRCQILQGWLEGAKRARREPSVVVARGDLPSSADITAITIKYNRQRQSYKLYSQSILKDSC